MTPIHPVVKATYTIETPLDLRRAAEAMAGEQSTGTFVPLPGTERLDERHGAVVLDVRAESDVFAPALSGTIPAGTFNRGQVDIAFPLENMGTAIPNLLATVAGNLFELNQLSGIRLERLELPVAFARAHPGPQFGIEGTRRLAAVEGRPIVGTIVKPSVGLSPSETGALVSQLARAGLDFVKDDELMANPPHSPFSDRLRAVMNHLRDEADRSGRLMMYAFNVTDELDEMLRHADEVAVMGGTCVMVSVNAIGISALRKLRENCSLPIHAHRNGWGAMTRHPSLGYSFSVWQQLWRLAGADHIHVNGLRNKFWEPDGSVLTSAREVLSPLNGFPGVMPVFSSAQTVHQVADTYTELQSSDLLFVAGGGIMAHPDGVAAGVQSIKQAWEAAMLGMPAAHYAEGHPALATALQFFEKRV